ncbi:hypothetical protein EGW08_021098 [Elysia chlorotica]|uniref:CUB domain-containing protein n=1 Tax=Elysia chlorotica TaxID=188477 RepID=A0A433SPJ1_ELYCH|nr:hypothetical protein EGW08_021098 [Elysia chlorotica]
MTVEFHSDSISEYQGFLATWTSVESTGNVIKEEKSECGEDLTGPQGTFQSPNYPEYTDTINRCVWTITTPPRTRPKLTFTDLRLGQCQFTYIYIRIGNADTSPLFSRYCGTSVPYPITLFGNSMYIDFRNIKAGIKARFKAEWATEL